MQVMNPPCGLLISWLLYLIYLIYSNQGFFFVCLFISEYLNDFWCWHINHYCCYLRCCWSQPSTLIPALAWLRMQENLSYSAQWNIFLLFRFSLCHFWAVATGSESVLIRETISTQFTVDLYLKEGESSEIWYLFILHVNSNTIMKGN